MPKNTGDIFDRLHADDLDLIRQYLSKKDDTNFMSTRKQNKVSKQDPHVLAKQLINEFSYQDLTKTVPKRWTSFKNTLLHSKPHRAHQINDEFNHREAARQIALNVLETKKNKLLDQYLQNASMLDFGTLKFFAKQGAKTSHPELLIHLAVRTFAPDIWLSNDINHIEIIDRKYVKYLTQLGIDETQFWSEFHDYLQQRRYFDNLLIDQRVQDSVSSFLRSKLMH